ncbi:MULTISPECIES: hypothetical protein [Chitinophaga]|uniref:hypothetical protein n=1 Tax=Chitinophaga TaxID=79328 RepID=UPI001455A8F1|nr:MULTISPECIES: hypothetical protein [Chitinophaga]
MPQKTPRGLKLSSILIILLFLTAKLSAQDKDLQAVIGPSPNVASLFKFKDQPISLYTGTAGVDIPIYTVKQGNIEIPITLKYHSGGVKVTENASWVGLSWALDAGGVVSQGISGKPDVPTATSGTRYNKKTLIDRCLLASIIAGNYDSQPDMFQFIAPGLSGSFYINDNYQFRQIPYSNAKIEILPTFQGGGAAWRITNTNGMVYIYSKSESVVSTSQVINNSNGMNDGGNVVPGPPNMYSVSSYSWHLTHLISPDGDTVTIDYENYVSQVVNFIGESQYYQAPGVLTNDLPSITNYELQHVTGWRIKQINSRNGTVKFVTGGNRCDVYGDRYLSEIQVINSAGKMVKKVQLRYKYLVNGALQELSSVDCSAEGAPLLAAVDVNRPELTRRLMLVGVDEADPASSQVAASYTMTYENAIGSGYLPSRFSSQQDFWGYFNGNQQHSLLQSLQQTTSYIQGINVPNITNRDPNFQYAVQGMLKQITYPTGGSSSFTYELNSVRQEGYTGCGTVIAIATKTYSLTANVGGQQVGTFTVNSCKGGDSVAFQISGCNFTDAMSPSTNLPYGFNITRSGTTYVTSQSIISQSGGHVVTGTKFYLSNGAYAITSFSTTGPPCTYTLTMPGRNEQQMETVSAQNEKPVGGLRVKQVINTDPIGNVSTIKKFEYVKTANGVTASSGTICDLLYAPFSNTYVTARDKTTFDGTFYYVEPMHPVLALNSNTNYPLRMTHGAQVGYSRVVEKNQDSNGNDNGYIVYNYTTDGDEKFQSPEIINAITGGGTTFDQSGLYPFAPSFSNEWSRGKLLMTEHYKNNGAGGYALVKREENRYSLTKITDTTEAYVPAYYLHSTAPYMAGCPSGGVTGSYDIFKYTPYNLYSPYQTLDSAIVTTIDDNGIVLTDTTVYTYKDGYQLPATTSKTDAKRRRITTNSRYVYDFNIASNSTDPIALGVKKQQDLNILSPVETYTQLVNPDGTSIGTINGIFTKYKTSPPLPDGIYSLEISTPITDYSLAAIGSGAAVIDSRYKLAVGFDAYDGIGNLLQQHKINDVMHSYVWDYSGVYPIAEATNADQSNIAYTSFETAAMGNWTLTGGTINTVTAATGERSMNLASGYTITKSALATGDYMVTYWSKSGSFNINSTTGTTIATRNGWTLYEHKLTGVSSISLTGVGTIDELRLYPVGAQMKTYTYLPAVGITSETDAGNKTVYYQYDNLMRLQTIRDQEGNIIKQNDYRYLQPITQ